MVDPSDRLSIRRQSQLLKVNRNRLKPSSSKLCDEDRKLCRLIDELHLSDPAFGARKLSAILRLHHQQKCSRARVARLMKHMRIEAVYRKPRTTLPAKGEEHRVYPYLLNQGVQEVDEAWCVDITYLPMARGYAYLVAILDIKTRSVLSWQLSNTMDTRFCLEAFNKAVKVAGKAPQILNSDQGCQFTSKAWRDMLTSHQVRISMDGKRRWVDNVFIERLWRSLKYEEVYLREYRDLHDLEKRLSQWFKKYNHWRPHQSLDQQRPWSQYRPEQERRAA